MSKPSEAEWLELVALAAASKPCDGPCESEFCAMARRVLDINTERAEDQKAVAS